jgi:7-cyano-7-deazaguanine synthase
MKQKEMEMPSTKTDLKKAIVLTSGGLDSTTALAIALSEGFECICLSFQYGQRHQIEIEAARKVAAAMHIARHEIISLDLGRVGGSALTDAAIDVPKKRSPEAMTGGIPVTYVPARNTLFLSYALAWAEARSAPDIFIGVNAVDYSGYPDCRPAYIAAFEHMANLALRDAVEGRIIIRVHAPLLHMSKADIIREGIRLGVDYGLTRSCYDPSKDGRACGVCDSCILRLKGFSEAGIPDPAPYANGFNP